MTHDINIDAELAGALEDLARYERSDEALVRHIVGRIERGPRRQTGARRSLRAALVAIGCVVAVGGGLAVAQPGALKTIFGDDENAPANKVQALQQDERAVDMSVFADVSTSALPEQQMVAMLEAAPLLNSDWGEPMPDFARELLTTTTAQGAVSVAAMPTTKGFVCVAYVSPAQSSSTCVDQLTDERPISVHGLGRGGQSVLIGIASDHVRSVSVLTESGHKPATLERNGFVWTGPDSDRPTALEVLLEDGRTVSIEAPKIGPT